MSLSGLFFLFLSSYLIFFVCQKLSVIMFHFFVPFFPVRVPSILCAKAAACCAQCGVHSFPFVYSLYTHCFVSFSTRLYGLDGNVPSTWPVVTVIRHAWTNLLMCTDFFFAEESNQIYTTGLIQTKKGRYRDARVLVFMSCERREQQHLSLTLGLLDSLKLTVQLYPFHLCLSVRCADVPWVSIFEINENPVVIAKIVSPSRDIIGTLPPSTSNP